MIIKIGKNVCLLSYGQTGSGKSHTMEGDTNNKGLYYAVADYLINNISNKSVMTYNYYV